MFAFSDFETARRAVKCLPLVEVSLKYGNISQSRGDSLVTPKQLFSASNMTQKWQKSEIGNFQYLMFLTTLSLVAPNKRFKPILGLSLDSDKLQSCNGS